MENDRSPASSSRIGVSQRQARIYAIAHELNKLTGESQKTVARSLFSALVRATGVNSGRVFLTNAQNKPVYCLVLVKGHPKEYDATTSPSLQEQALAGWTYHERRGVLIDDTANDARWASWSQAPEADSARSALAVPLLLAAGPIGAVALIAERPHHFVQRDQGLIADLAARAAIVIENARLTQEKDQSLRRLAFLNETGQAITSTLNLDQILQLLIGKVQDLLQIDAVSIALRDERTGDLVFEAASGVGAEEVLGVRLRPGQGIAGWVAEKGRPLLVNDVYDDPRFYDGVDGRTGFRTQALLCIPIVAKGRVVGIIEALNPDRSAFDRQTIKLLKALSDLAASAVENARLFAQVRRAEACYAGLFKDSTNPIVITDMKGIVIDANRSACALLGQTEEALRGANLASLRSASDNQEFVNPFEQIRADGETVFQTDILSDGQRITVEVKGKRILVEDSALVQWVGRDISAEIELEETREDMVRMIIHDLRNPLANIMNSLAVLTDVINEKDVSVSVDELLHIAKRSGQRMHQLISSILDISRLETGQALLETQPTHLVPLLHDVIEFISPQTEIREIDITADFDPNLPQVEIDADMISRVVLNLLENANKFTPMGGSIQITANVRGPNIEVAVSDNGPGISAEQIPNVFEKFTRIKMENGPEGIGLGLAFCKLAVETHGGRIWAESKAGEGTTLRFTLPVHDRPPATG